MCVQLPDGNELQVGPERFNIPEILFQPVRSSLGLAALDRVLQQQLWTRASWQTALH